MSAPKRRLAEAPSAADGWRRLAIECLAENPRAAVGFQHRLLALVSTAADWSNLAEMRRQAGLSDGPRAARRALALDPAFASAHLNLGNLLMQADRAPSAEPAFRRALALDPASRDAAYNLAAALAERGRPEAALALYDALVGRFPDFFEAQWNRALALLASGRWREGWQAHELRRHHPALAPRRFPIPGWDGTPLAGRRILLASEQGLGDTLQFLRYVPEVIRRGGRVVLEVQRPLLALARTIAGLEDLITDGSPLPTVDLEAPLISLPHLLASAAPPLPPYLQADPERRRHWREVLSEDPRPKIGVAWAGNPEHRHDRRRSLGSEALASLAAVADVRFVSLQKEKGAPPGWLDVAPDFADTAAIAAELDLVIAVDTAIAHLACALYKPLWVLLAPGVDWRWPRGPRSPWYPSARQVWRDAEGDWSTAIEKIARRLRTTPLDLAGDFPGADFP